MTNWKKPPSLHINGILTETGDALKLVCSAPGSVVATGFETENLRANRGGYYGPFFALCECGLAEIRDTDYPNRAYYPTEMGLEAVETL